MQVEHRRRRPITQRTDDRDKAIVVGNEGLRFGIKFAKTPRKASNPVVPFFDDRPGPASAKLVRDNDVNRVDQGMACDGAITAAPMEDLDTTSIESGVKVMDNNVKESLLNDEERLNVATCDTVVNAPSSLMLSKHKAIRVVEDESKRVVKDNNGRTTYGQIHRAGSKGMNRSLPTGGLPRKVSKSRTKDNH
ncbi:hypothetical protein V6N12_069173 [Hibiscus sabdariffa]|uniref:Uncharacterized protein n=1 Tax=Hibiscus sabdariffa TaxID=183260 RepID=A0ABR2FDJ7_9ROSI